MSMSFQELLSKTRARIVEVSVDVLVARLRGASPPVLLDVREPDETPKGVLAGALLLPRGLLELRIEELVPDRSAPLVVYCAGGTRSALCTDTLATLGYTNVASLVGGFQSWKNAGRPVVMPRVLSEHQRTRYSRHILLSEVGEAGQSALLGARVLLVGVGELGSPIALYLAAAGVGTLGLIDDAVLDAAQVQRALAHEASRVGTAKVLSAKSAIEAQNPDVQVVPHEERLCAQNAVRIVSGYDLVIDASNHLSTRYLINDACVLLGKPNVYGALNGTQGQVTVFERGQGPCYRCLYPVPPAEEAPDAAWREETAVLPGVIGTMQATEALKLLLRKGTSLSGRLMLYDALETKFRELLVRKDPACPACGEVPRVGELSDISGLCGANLAQAMQ